MSARSAQDKHEHISVFVIFQQPIVFDMALPKAFFSTFEWMIPELPRQWFIRSAEEINDVLEQMKVYFLFFQLLKISKKLSAALNPIHLFVPPVSFDHLFN